MLGYAVARFGGCAKMEVEDYISSGAFTGEDLMLGSEPTMDPYPFYPVLDGAGDMCIGKGDGCDVCSVGKQQEEVSLFPSQLPLLDWSDVESQLGEVHEDAMQCVNMNQIFDMSTMSSIKTEPSPEVMDKVISDCMWSSSSTPRSDVDTKSITKVKIEHDMDTQSLPKLKIENETNFSRPETPQTDSESLGTDCDDLIQRVPREKSVKVAVAVSAKPQVSSGRSLLKRNQFLKVVRAPYRNEQKSSLSSPAVDTSYAGDHSYSATTVIGILTPSPSPSESSSEDDVAEGRQSQARHRQRAPVDSETLSQRLLNRPLKTRSKHSRSGHKYRSERSRVHSDDDLPPPERRNNHNNMERMRRDLLRGALHTLRRLVPDTAANDKAPKITVLREAAKYCLHLRSRDEALTRQKRRLEDQREALRRRLDLLQQRIR